MRRLLCLVVLGAAVALPLPAATACSPALPVPDVDRDRVAPGGTLRVSGDEVVGPFDCMPPMPPLVSASPTASASGHPVGSASPSPDPGGPLPTGLPTPFFPTDSLRVSKPATRVRILLRPYTEWHEHRKVARRIAAVPPARPLRITDEHTRHRFSARVTIPADVAPGRYFLEALQPGVVSFGSRVITVALPLPATGRDTTDLVRLGLMAVATGAVAVTAARRRERGRA